MTADQMAAALTARTHDTDATRITDALNQAQDWCLDKLYLSGEDVATVFETSLSPATNTQDYALATEIQSAVGNVLYGIKNLWVKYSGESEFSLVVFKDSSDPDFIERDQLTAQKAYPLYADVTNFNQVRFAPPLPASTTLRVDYHTRPPDINWVSAGSGSNISSVLPTIFHMAITKYAEGVLYENLDDTRSVSAKRDAEKLLATKQQVLKKRVTPDGARTRPFSKRSSQR